LGNIRLRIVLVVVVWSATAVSLALWLGGRERPELTLAAGSASSETYQIARAIADELSEVDSSLRIRVFETGGSIENLELLETGQVDLALTQSDIALPEEALGIALLYPDAHHLVVRAESGIRHFSELRGQRVAIPQASSAQNPSFWFVADHYGLDAADFTALPMSSSAANFAMQQGQIDAVFRVRAPGNLAIRELIRSGDIEIVPINQADALNLAQPAMRAGEIPKGSYRGFPPLPVDNLPTVVSDRYLVAHEDLPTELTYRFTRDIFEARSDLVARFALAGQMSPLPEDADSAIPAHPGARRYFDREKPGLVSQNARLFSAFLYVVVLAGSGLIALRARWLRSRRLRMGDFNERLMDIAQATRGCNDRERLFDNKNRLMDILAEVVHDLDAERVSQEEFEHFSFTWQAVDAMVRDQLMLMGVNIGDASHG
jgi:TRAP transporter TAXI family solute receptor